MSSFRGSLLLGLGVSHDEGRVTPSTGSHTQAITVGIFTNDFLRCRKKQGPTCVPEQPASFLPESRVVLGRDSETRRPVGTLCICWH